MKTEEVCVGNAVFGDKFLYCIPLAEKTAEELAAAAERIVPLSPDLLEWRADAMDYYPDVREILPAAERLRRAAGNIPLIFTTRCPAEGGFREISPEEKFRLIRAAASSGCIEAVDLELSYLSGAADLTLSHQSDTGILVRELQAAGIKVIVSYHNLKEAMEENQILGILKREQETGADIVKAVFHLDTFHQLRCLGETVEKARNQFLTQPLILGADGAMAVTIRLAAPGLGGAMTYVSGAGASSHPSQVDIDDLRRIHEIMRSDNSLLRHKI